MPTIYQELRLLRLEMINPTMPESELVFVLQIAPNMPKRDNDDIGYDIGCATRGMCFSISLLLFSWSWRDIGSNSDDYNAFSLCVASIVHFFNRHTKLNDDIVTFFIYYLFFA